MHSSNIAVTVAIDHVEFKSAAKIGDIIEIIAHVTNAFNTSMEVYVEVSKRDAVLQTPVKINEAYFIFVCLDRDEKLVKVPPVIPQTKREKELFAAAIKRRKDRNRNK